MKKIYLFLSSRLLTPALFILPCLDAYAQNSPSPVYREYAGQIKFLVHAPIVLPALWQEQKWDSMQNFLANWKNAFYPNQELIFGAGSLLAIETGKFDSLLLPCDLLFSLSDYARELKAMEAPGNKFKYYIRLSYKYTYDATEDVRQVILFMQSWARHLLTTRSLDSSELFFCRVLAGEIKDPQAEFRSNKLSYPRLARSEENLNAYNNAWFMARRDGRRGTAGIMAGWWSPTGHLQTLGAHPSIGVQLGIRNRLNEYDLTWSFRFLHPTPQDYTYMRHDTLYTSNYYDGGYIGFEYTRYFLHRKYIDLGFISGIGYDYFDVHNGFGKDDPDQRSLIPLNVGSFDFNNGVRLKYFFRRRGFIGLTAKYHLIHYANNGGTDLDGNAFSIDLSYGSH